MNKRSYITPKVKIRNVLLTPMLSGSWDDDKRVDQAVNNADGSVDTGFTGDFVEEDEMN